MDLTEVRVLTSAWTHGNGNQQNTNKWGNPEPDEGPPMQLGDSQRRFLPRYVVMERYYRSMSRVHRWKLVFGDSRGVTTSTGGEVGKIPQLKRHPSWISKEEWKEDIRV